MLAMVMSQSSDAELIHIVTEMRKDYQPEAVAAAENELVKRKISSEQMDSALLEIEKQKQSQEDIKNEPLRNSRKIRAFFLPNPLNIFAARFLQQKGEDQKAKDMMVWTLSGIAFYVTLFF
jgi:hypothetical protein